MSHSHRAARQSIRFAIGSILVSLLWAHAGFAAEPTQRYWLQFKKVTLEESAVSDQGAPLNTVPQSIAFATHLGDPFYVRHVDDRQQTIVQGTLERDTQGAFRLTYVLDIAPLDSMDTPIRVLKGEAVAVDWNAPTPIEAPIDRKETVEPSPKDTWLVSLSPWVMGIAIRDRFSGATIRVLDPNGAPASGVLVAFYDVREGWLRTTPLPTNEAGWVSHSEARELLTRTIVVALDSENGWYAETRLDRTYADFTREPVYTIRLRNADAFDTKLLDDPDVVRYFRRARAQLE